MPRLVRKQIYIEPRQDAVLKQKARLLGVTEAEVIREAIDRQMASVGLDVRDRKAWEREKAFVRNVWQKDSFREPGAGSGKMLTKKG